jgi:hypothetical protein
MSPHANSSKVYVACCDIIRFVTALFRLPDFQLKFTQTFANAATVIRLLKIKEDCIFVDAVRLLK